MKNQERIFWGIHAGSKGEADALFLKKGYIAIGWEEMGDMSNLPTDWDKLKALVKETYTGAKPGAIPNYAGQFKRFVHEMKKGDFVIYPSKIDKKIHIGKITGDYQHLPSLNKDYPNQRKVEWLKEIARTVFSQGALYEVGSALTVFQVKNYVSEFISVLEGQEQTYDPFEDETVNIVAGEIEQITIDFVLKTLSQKLHGHPLEGFVANLLETMGYRASVTQLSGDQGVDVIAHRDELGLHPPIIKVQVKSSESSIGRPAVSQLYGVIDANEVGLYVTLGSYTKQARDFEKNKSNLRLVDGEELVGLILAHYQDLSPRYKALIPLKQICVPDPPKDEE
jgi:restriction system protein